MNRWLQTEEYTCPNCGVKYLHDKAHWHAAYRCPMRHQAVSLRKSADVVGYSQHEAELYR